MFIVLMLQLHSPFIIPIPGIRCLSILLKRFNLSSEVASSLIVLKYIELYVYLVQMLSA
ncbi:hypothetical protein KR49_06420 [Synechococcus sp. KORDI-49]|nr:hypothetical protein KR49_06420 [Synechococcus sp. KORDI-49]